MDASRSLLVRTLIDLAVEGPAAPPEWRLDNFLGMINNTANRHLKDFAVIGGLTHEVQLSLGNQSVDPRALACLEVHAIDNARRAPDVDPESMTARMYALEDLVRALDPSQTVARLMDFLGYQMRVFTRKGGSWNDQLFERGVNLSVDSFRIVPNPEGEAQLEFERLIERANSAIVNADFAFGMDDTENAVTCLSLGVPMLEAVIDPGGKLGSWIEHAHVHRIYAYLWSGLAGPPDYWVGFDRDMDILTNSIHADRRALAQALRVWNGAFNEANEVVDALQATCYATELNEITTDAWGTAMLLMARAMLTLGEDDEANRHYNLIIARPGHDGRAVKAVARRELAALIPED